MAGDWIKIEHATPDKPELVMMAEHLGIDQDAVFGKLMRLWIWADQQSLDGNDITVTESFIDRITFLEGFAAACRRVGWLEGRDGRFSIPNFSRHNGHSSKQRATANRRVANSRVNKNDGCNGATVTDVTEKHNKCNGESVTNVTEKHNKCNEKTLQKALPEKRREEKSILDTNVSCPQADAWRRLWDIAPSKARSRSSKKQTEDAWKRIKTSDRPDEETLVDSIEAWKQSEEWRKDEGQYIQGLHLWIKNRQWENIPEPIKDHQSKTPDRKTGEFQFGGRKGIIHDASQLEMPDITE